MSYNEYKYEKTKSEYQKMASNFISVDDFISIYAIGLKEYLVRRTLNDGHIEDLAVENAAFAESFLITIGVING